MSLAAAALQSLSAAPRTEGESPARSTSCLSADELLAVAQVGYEPVGIVMGSAVARPGYNAKWSLRPFRNYEIWNHSNLMNNVRRKAISSLKARCTEVGGAGVIGVSLNLEGIEKDGLVTFVATGTALRPIDQAPIADASPFTSSLSGRDFHLLLRGNGRPVGFVVASSSYHFGLRTFAKWVASEGRCAELTTLTESLYGARESAIERLHQQVADLSADGAMDVKVVERPAVWGKHVIEFLVYGTAVTFGRDVPDLDNASILVLLNDQSEGAPTQHGGTFARLAPTPTLK